MYKLTSQPPSVDNRHYFPYNIKKKGGDEYVKG